MAPYKKFPADLLLSLGQKIIMEVEETLQALKEGENKFSITTTLKLKEFSSYPKHEKPNLPTSFPGPTEAEDVELEPSKSGEEDSAAEEKLGVAARTKKRFPQKNLSGLKNTKRMHAPKKPNLPFLRSTSTKRDKRRVEGRPRC